MTYTENRNFDKRNNHKQGIEDGKRIAKAFCKGFVAGAIHGLKISIPVIVVVGAVSMCVTSYHELVLKMEA